LNCEGSRAIILILEAALPPAHFGPLGIISMMESIPRHQCLIYDGAPSQLLPELAAGTQKMLLQHYRCLYLNSQPMVAGMRSYLAATGVDVAHETTRTSLVLSSARQHLSDGRFEVERMMQSLEDALKQALSDGYEGLWATGDMTWEMGPEKDFSKLLEYEWQLETFFHDHPQLSGICQYHAGTLPREVLRHSLLVHPSLFVSETLSLINSHYMPRESFSHEAVQKPELDHALHRACKQRITN
jgi:hypothetical protein